MEAKIVISAFLAVIATATSAWSKQLPPKDACQSNKSFWVFRTHFADIVKRRDTKALISITDPRIKTSFGGDGGTAEFISMWGLDKDRGLNSSIWREFDEILLLGCNATAEQASMPYMFGSWPEGKDAFDTLIAKGTNIALRSGPSTKSKVLTRMSWEIVTIARHPSGEEPQNWTRIRTDKGQIGYISNDYLRSAIDYRALFNLINGEWVMTAMIAGD